jgi:phage virion morphogenesis protein
MTGVTLNVQLDDTAARDALAGLGAALTDLTPLMDRIGSMLQLSTDQRFETETGPDGQRWKPSRRAQREGGKTLTLSARLRQSITHRASAEAVEIGTNVVYAAIHQFGGTIDMPARTQTIYRHYDERNDELSTRFVKRRKSNFAQDVEVKAHKVKMPARPYLGISAADEKAVVEEVTAYISELLQ